VELCQDCGGRVIINGDCIRCTPLALVWDAQAADVARRANAEALAEVQEQLAHSTVPPVQSSHVPEPVA
jgi:hypothetical protein